jgi:hypothetical protein
MIENTQYYGHLLTAQWDVVPALCEIESSFVLVLLGLDSMSLAFEKVLQGFLASHYLHNMIIKVLVIDEVAKSLVVSYLPQIRIYEEGREIVRHRGAADYETLKRLLF